MSRNSNDSAYGGSSSGGSWGRRKSGLFALSALSGSSASESNMSTLKKHRKRPSLLTGSFDHPDMPRDHMPHTDVQQSPVRQSPAESPRLYRPSLSARNSASKTSTVFGSFKSAMRSGSNSAYDGVGEPLSATSTTSAASTVLSDSPMDIRMSNKVVLSHGEVQTSAGMFRKKREYLVLTEASMIRYKSQAKAAEAFNAIPNPATRTPTTKHGQVPSLGSASDLQTLSDSSGDKDGRVPLRHVVSVNRLDDGKPYFAIEVCYLDEDSTHSSAMTLQYGNPEDRDRWLRAIRRATKNARLQDARYIAPNNLEMAARVVERENDYDPSNCSIYKVVQRQAAGKSVGRSSSDDLAKVASTVCFLAIGVHKVHLIQLAKAVTRSSSPSLSSPTSSQGSYGILTLNSIRVSKTDDSFELSFRRPLQNARHLYLASTASYEIAARLHSAENFLRPEYATRLYKMDVPPEVEEMLIPGVSTSGEELFAFERTLTAYCVAYGMSPANIRYVVNYQCEDAPRFELLPPADSRRPEYGPLELIAITRALRYNESFGSLSFANIPLDSLNGLHDNYGKEYVCIETKAGTPIKLSEEELSRSCLLVQEVRAMAATSKKLRRLDFSSCIVSSPQSTHTMPESGSARSKDLGCGIVEALFPLCRHQTTNVDWVCLNGICLSDTDLDYLVGAAVEKACHFRAIELNQCGLTDRSLGLILDALRAQDNTLEAIELAGNTARINPAAFDAQLGIFGFIRNLNLSYASRTSGSEPLLQAETLLNWRLSQLRLSGTNLNTSTIDAVATYLVHPNSDSLHELFIDHAYLSGGDIATLLYSMMRSNGAHRNMHLDVSQNHLSKDLDQVVQAIANGMAPSHVTMKAIEYRDESSFRKMLGALTVNKTIQYLDISHTALPGDASDDTCRALERLLGENDTLLELNMSGEDSRLATSRFGPGINDALAGLKRNKTLQVFRVENQKLGLQGASTLADVLKENTTLRELHCDRNEIPLHGLTDLVNSLVTNTSIIHLPSMLDGRSAAFHSAEQTMKTMSGSYPPNASTRNFSGGSTKISPLSTSSFAMKRGLASVRRSATRSHAPPSFPALPTPLHTSTTLSPPRTRQASSTGPVAAPVSFTVQDVQTTHRLLAEQWDRQCFRLTQYLERNWCLLHGLPTADEGVTDEAFERPSSVGSLGKMLERVKMDTTPRGESPPGRQTYFDGEEQQQDGYRDGKEVQVQSRWLFDSSPEEDEVEDEGKRQLRLVTEPDHGSEPRTPTQAKFQL
ncbi:hypothetical protein LTR95_004754 [Oleoguttula sp. CCFEE 5521]